MCVPLCEELWGQESVPAASVVVEEGRAGGEGLGVGGIGVEGRVQLSHRHIHFPARHLTQAGRQRLRVAEGGRGALRGQNEGKGWEVRRSWRGQ